MTRLEWDDPQERPLRIGIDRGAVYPDDGECVIWNGLTSVVETTPDVDHRVLYFDGMPVIQEFSPGGFAAKVSAFTYPDKLNELVSFGFTYRTLLNEGYELHLVYNADAVASDIGYNTVTESLEPLKFEWDLSSVPVQFIGARACSHLIIDSNDVNPDIIDVIEDLIYGTDTTDPRFPDISEIVDLFEKFPALLIIDHGDGTWSAIGPPDMVEMIDATTFKITSQSAEYIAPDTYKIRSW